MKNLKNPLTQNRNYLLFSLMLLFGSSNLTGQNNALKITPLKPIFDKMNVGYERILKNDWSVSTDFQFWFKEKDDTIEKFWDTPEEYNFVSKGLRSSLELRKYFLLGKEDAKIQHHFSLALSLHLGKHHIEHTRSGYDEMVPTISLFGSDPLVRNYKSPSYGEADLISGGAGFHFGYRILWKNGLFIHTEIISRKSWSDYKEDNISLIPTDGTTPTETYYISSDIIGKNLEPKLSVGFMF